MANLTVSYSRQGDVHTIETGGGALATMVIDNTTVPQDARSGTAKQLLAASALFCYATALVGALEARGAKYTDIQANATLEVGGNDLGQGRVKKITIESKVTLPEEDSEIFERVEKIMRQGCLVTGSLHDGIDMAYSLQAKYED